MPLLLCPARCTIRERARAAVGGPAGKDGGRNEREKAEVKKRLSVPVLPLLIIRVTLAFFVFFLVIEGALPFPLLGARNIS
jgi:hypothetical protein